MKLYQYLIEFEAELAHGSVFGVTASSEEEATAIVFEEVFHNQTIPGKHTVRKIRPFWRVRIGRDNVPRKIWKQQGIWYPEAYKSNL